jgi:hypothetical protein
LQEVRVRTRWGTIQGVVAAHDCFSIQLGKKRADVRTDPKRLWTRRMGDEREEGFSLIQED